MKETEVMDRLRSWTWWPFAVFAGATAIMFWRFVFAGHTLFAGDTAYVFLPLRMYGADRLGAGDLPLWNPCIFGGVPYLADPQTQLFYPLQVLFPLLGSPRAIGLSIPLHAFLACCTTYGFARRVLRLAPAAATVSGLLFGLGGLFQVRIEVPIYYAFLPWLPATLWATEVLRSRPTVVRFAIASVSFAMCLSTACIPSIFHLGQALAIRTFFRPKEDGARRRAVRERLRYLALLLGIIVAGAALALAALLPLTELAALSDRSFRPDYDFATNYSIRPLWLVSGLLLPTLYGSFQTPETFGFSMAPFTFYVGIIGVLLVGAAIVAPARHPWTRYSVVLSLLSCFLAIGRHNPVYPLLYRYVPGFAMFRGSSGILLLFALSLSCLAGVGANHLLSASTKERSRVARRACVLGLGMGVIMAILLTLGPRPDGQSDAEFGAGQSRQLLFLVLSLVVLLAVWRPRDLGRLLARSRTVAGLWIVLAVLDLCVFSQ
ncbi:MAG: hypothetical protein ACE5JM_13810, partial [Armatimonadota bacterium]